MATDRIERLCHEIRAAELTMKKDTAKRAFAFALMLGLLIWMGQTVISVSLLILFAVTETLFVWLTRRGPDDFASVPDFASLPMASMKIGMMVATVTAFMVPSVLMVTNVDLPIVLAGFVWWFCLATHIVNVYAATTYLLCILMAPVTLGLGAIVLVAKASNHHTASATDWGIMVTCLVSYIFILIDTMRRNSDSKRELLSAQVEANSRLRALEHLSNHDSLTGLLNRRAFDEKLTELLSEDPHDGNDVAVMIVDLDGFKPINDTYSHEAGDQVLQTIGRRLLQLCEETGIVARLGGDEFALAFGAMRSDRMAVRLANYLVREINRPIVFEDKDLTVAASVGVSLASVAGKSVEVLCSTADLAMYRAKTNRTGTAELFDPANFAKRATLEDRKVLSEALRSREIRPFYQPKIRLADGATIGFEALARWVHPEDGLRSPGTFIPAINELGLQGDFLLHICDQVLIDISLMLSEGLDPGQVSINVPEVALTTQSGRQHLEELLDRYPDARKLVTLEITEDVFIARASDAIRTSISTFRRAGQRVSLDDFGTGFASFQHLRQLEFDELKIDTSFVAGLGVDKKNEVLIRGFLSMAQGLDVTVVAEGVETAKQANQLRDMGCEYAQGYLFGKAMPLDETRIRLHGEATSGAWGKWITGSRPPAALTRHRPAVVSLPPAAQGG